MAPETGDPSRPRNPSAPGPAAPAAGSAGRIAIEPIRRRPAGPAPPPEPPRSGGPRRGWIALAAVALLLTFVGGILLGRSSGPPSAPAAPAPEPPKLAPESTAQPPSEPAPAPDPTLQPQEVQQLLGRIQSVRSRLEPHVRRWAAEPFARAEELVRKGEDALVRERTGEAAGSLKEALAQLESLAAKEGEAFDDALARGNAAIGAGDATAARQALEVALAIRPDDSAAQAALARAEALPEVMALLEEGRREEEDGRWESARDAYARAVQRDPAQAEAREGVARMSGKIEDAEVRLLVTRGLSAFTAGRLDAAIRDFQAALRLRPGDVEARRSLAQAREEQLIVEVRRHLETARGDEAAERWGAAVAAWEAALKLDPNLAEASEGLERARRRQLLDERLGELLGDATRLYDRDALARAERILVAVRGITPKSPKLARQEAELARRVQVAATPLPVFLESDGLTEVTIQREKRLGTLQIAEVRLRPGTYVVVGARKGYRDVRRTLYVEPGAPPPRLVVKCEERI